MSAINRGGKRERDVSSRHSMGKAGCGAGGHGVGADTSAARVPHSAVPKLTRVNAPTPRVSSVRLVCCDGHHQAELDDEGPMGDALLLLLLTWANRRDAKRSSA